MQQPNKSDIIIVTDEIRNIIDYKDDVLYLFYLSAEEEIEEGLVDEYMHESLSEEDRQKKIYSYLSKSFSYTDENGETKRKKVFAKTVEELERKYDEAKRKLLGISSDKNRMTVEEWHKKWLETCKPNYNDRAKRENEGRFKNHMLPVFGHMYVDEVDYTILQNWYNTYSGRNSAIVRKLFTHVTHLFHDAVVRGRIISYDPAAALIVPPTFTNERRPMTEKESQFFYEVMLEHEHGVFIGLLRFLGLRVGEAAARRPSDFDLAKQTVYINSAVEYAHLGSPIDGNVKAKNIAKSRGSIVSPDYGSRYIPIPDVLMPFIIKMLNDANGDELLFTETDGKILRYGTISTWWSLFQKDCHIKSGAQLGKYGIIIPETSSFGFDLTPHCLRHTYGADLLDAEIQETICKSLLGHARSGTTEKYQKIKPELFLRIAKKINEYYNNKYDNEYAKGISPVSISFEVNSDIYAKLVSTAMRNGHDFESIFEDAIKSFAVMYEKHIRNNPLITLLDAAPLGASTETVEISLGQKFLDKLNNIATECNITMSELYSSAMQCYITELKSVK